MQPNKQWIRSQRGRGQDVTFKGRQMLRGSGGGGRLSKKQISVEKTRLWFSTPDI